MGEWTKKTLGEVVRFNYGKSLPAKKRIFGDVPVYGSNGIVGYHKTAIVNGPGIIVGRKGSVGAVHISRQPFCPIDTTYFIIRQGLDHDLNFLYYLLLSLDLSRLVSDLVPGLNRDLAYLQEIYIPIEKSEQRRIAAILSAVQRAIEQQEELIARTTELKKALMYKLFTEGTRGEPQKDTEIGIVPESWEIFRLDDIADSFTYGTSVKCDYNISGVPVLRIPNVVGGQIDLIDIKYGLLNSAEIENLKLKYGDLLFVRTNGVKENAGRCSMYRNEILNGCYFASYLIRVRFQTDKILPEFVNEYTRTETGSSFLSGKASRTADGKFNINTGTLKGVIIPVPSLDEQREIVEEIGLIDEKSVNHKSHLQLLKDLFKTLLHQLMTAEIRVDNVDLSKLRDIGIDVE
ncbi:type I restriction enzyme S subunit [Methanocalculus alkaliphilus]|uniref:restriction endonuclease subunit S n=1 Tax=Methanocalculus alkaliphilus TaxID=768730 RepID=UPI0020A15349|nr:type I restriction enzyme S subunit [Methanocalculus alkaliphilus]